MRSRHDEDVALGDSVQALKDDFQQFKNDISDLVRRMAHVGAERTAGIGRHLRDTAGESLEHVREGIKAARDYGAEKIDVAGKTVQRHPFLSTACALGMGLIVGRLFFRWR